MSARKRKVGVGVVGLGRIAGMHLPTYVDHPRAELRALCDANPEALKVARVGGDPRPYTDFDRFLEDDAIDLVEILTPHHLHREMALKALAAGKHVSLQKPIAVNLAESREIVDAARKAPGKFKVFENFVFYPPYRKARELIEAGEIGDVISLRLRLTTCTGGWSIPLASWLWRLQETEHGGGPTVHDDGYHKFSMAMFFGGPVDKVSASIDRSFVYVDTPAMISWRHTNGILGSMEMLFAPNVQCQSRYYSADERIEITGTKGVIYLPRCSGMLHETAGLILCKGGRSITFDDLETDWYASFRDSASHFIDCILDGGEPELTGEQGYAVQQFTLAAIHAARIGGPVSVPDFTGAEVTP